MHLALPIPNAACFVVMLRGALQRNAKHEARLSNISDYFRGTVWTERSEILSFAQNDSFTVCRESSLLALGLMALLLPSN